MVHRDLVRKLADWVTSGLPVTSLYLDVDGRRYPQPSSYLPRAERFVHRAHERAEDYEGEAARSVHADATRMWRYLRESFDRRGTRGVVLFSCSGAELWEEVHLPRPVRDRVTVASSPYLLPLESVLERAETFCIVLIGREKARVLVSSLEEIGEVTSVLDEVPGRHDQGGWAQGRLQRHIEDHVLRHLKRVAEALLRLHQRRRFDHLVLSGVDEVVADLERELHDYVRRTVVARIALPVTASTEEVLAQVGELERDLERHREEGAVSRVASEATAGTGRAVAGMQDTLGALEAGRVETLVISAGLEAHGVRCTSCGHLAEVGARCVVCGFRTEEVSDLVEEAVESGLRQRCRVETVAEAPALEAIGGIGALLRF